VKPQSDTISLILKNYTLCEFCAGRLLSKFDGKPQSKLLGKKLLKKFSKSSDKKCHVCKNIFDNLDNMFSNIYEKSSSFDFKTFHIGITLKPSLLERDDNLKSKFKIKGIENIKFSLASELTKKISRRTNLIRVVNDPDLTIQANFKDESCTLRAKPMFVYGRYTKNTRKIPQQKKQCTRCNGFGCHNCDFNGIKNVQSVESEISNLLIKKFDANQIKINWIGGEDQSSLVLGNGRPFFAKIINPKKRNRILRKSFELDGIHLSELQKMSIQPKGSIAFKSQVSITIDAEKPISSIQLRKLKNLENIEIKDPSRDKKYTKKQIYTVHYKKLGKKSFKLDLLIDGGIPLKSFVQNSDVFPNVSDLVKNRCICRTLDFKNIQI